MKSKILIALLIAFSAVGIAQKKEIKKAEKALESGEITEANQYITQAEGMLGAADNDTKTQFYIAKGNITLSQAGKSDFNKMKAAAESFKMAAEMDSAGKYSTELNVASENLRNSLVNSAIDDQNAERYKDASEKLYMSYMASKKDTSDLYFAAGNLINAKDYTSALKYYKMLNDMGFTGATSEYVATNKETGEVKPFSSQSERDVMVKSGEFIKPEIRKADSKKAEILRNMTLIYLSQGEKDKATQLMKEARAENPTDVALMRADADMAYQAGDLNKYNELMEQVIASDPTNAELYFNLGVSSANLGLKDKAIGYYKKAIELDPDYTSAQVNMAALMLKEETAIVDEMNKLGTSTADNKKYDELKVKREQLFKDALPYLEAAANQGKASKEVLKTLINIYSQLGQDDKSKAMREKMEAMTDGN